MSLSSLSLDDALVVNERLSGASSTLLVVSVLEGHYVIVLLLLGGRSIDYWTLSLILCGVGFLENSLNVLHV